MIFDSDWLQTDKHTTALCNASEVSVELLIPVKEYSESDQVLHLVDVNEADSTDHTPLDSR